MEGLLMAPTTAQPVTYGRDPAWFRFSVAKYQKMIEVGILGKYDKVELLEGYVALKLTRNPQHDGTLQLIQHVLACLLPSGWDFRVLSSVEMSDSQPEPDFAVVRGASRTYTHRYPGAQDVALLVEVANSSLVRDTVDKARIYARAGIPCY